MTLSESSAARAVVAFGSNIHPEAHLPAALDLLETRLQVIGRSRVYRSSAVGRERDPPFLNAAVEVITSLLPVELKAQILRPAEAQLGRLRGHDRFAPRRIDLDLVLYLPIKGSPELGSAFRHDSDLDRYLHVLLPVLDLDPDRLHPVVGRPLAALAREMLTGAPTPPEPIVLPGWVPQRSPP